MNYVSSLPYIPYKYVEWYWVTGHYDIHWRGYAYYKGKLHEVQTHDLTDYQTMTDTCPCCSVDGDNYKDCDCQSYTELHCVLTPLSWYDTIKVHIEKFYWEHIGRPYLFWKNRKRLK